MRTCLSSILTFWGCSLFWPSQVVVADVFQDVPAADLAGYEVLYDLAMPADGNYIIHDPIYTVDRSQEAGAFSEIGYYVELGTATERKWIFITMDAWTQQRKTLGVPDSQVNPICVQQAVANGRVWTNQPGIPTGAVGKVGLEFWIWSTLPMNLGHIPGASSTLHDTGDVPQNWGGESSFNINLLGDSPQVLFSWQNFGWSGMDGIGIGNAPTGNPDYQLARNAAQWQTRRLQILIRPTPHQVTLSAFPSWLQLYPRNLATNKATVTIQGEEAAGGWETAELTIYTDEALTSTVNVPLTYTQGRAVFQFQPEITAALVKYDFALHLIRDGQRSLVRRANNVLAGDAYQVQGQSNAEALVYEAPLNASWSNPFCVTWGDNTFPYPDPVKRPGVEAWHHCRAYRAAIEESTEIGAWPMCLANLLIQQSGVPVAMINGAKGGLYIGYFTRYDWDPTNKGSVYGRMLHRSHQAGLTNHYRAIIYYQGENDGPFPPLHADLWPQVRRAWREDYPSLEQIYFMQIHGGCGSNLSLHNIQSRFEEQFPDVTVMSTHGIPGHDGCHIDQNGHAMLATRLADRILYDLHGIGSPVPFSPKVNRFVFDPSAPHQLRGLLRDPRYELTPVGPAASVLGLHSPSVAPSTVSTAPGEFSLSFSSPIGSAFQAASLGSPSASQTTLLQPLAGGLLASIAGIVPTSLSVQLSLPAGSSHVLGSSPLALANNTGGTGGLKMWVDGNLLTETAASMLQHVIPSQGKGTRLVKVSALDAAGRTADTFQSVEYGMPTLPAGPSAHFRKSLGQITDERGNLASWESSVPSPITLNTAGEASRPWLNSLGEAAFLFAKFRGYQDMQLSGISGPEYTISMSLRLENRVHHIPLLRASDGSFLLELQPATERLKIGSNLAPAPCKLWEWHTLCVDFNAAATNIYLNGQLLFTDPNVPLVQDFCILGSPGHRGAYASLAEILTYPRALTAAEMAQLHAYQADSLLSVWQTWQRQLPAAVQSKYADPDQDNLPNWFEFLLGTSPQLKSEPLRVQNSPAGITLTHPRRKNLPVGTLGLEWSADLMDWSAVENVAPTLQDIDTDIESLTYTLPTSVAPVRFYRVINY